MRTRYRILILAALIAAGHPAAGAPAPTKQDTPPAAVKQPQSPEIRPSTPEDEALKRLLGQRSTRKGITLSSGPLSRPHKVLGTVSVETAPPAAGADAKPGPNLYLNEVLRGEAIKLYGEKNVDGIMNITYKTAADGKQRASGTAVHFEEQAGGKAPE